MSNVGKSMSRRSPKRQLGSFLCLAGLVLQLVSCGGGYTSGTNHGGSNGGGVLTLETVGVASGSPMIEVSDTVEMVALAYQGTTGSQTSVDVTNSSTWTASNPNVATVDKGVVTGTAMGSTTISATYNHVTRSITVVVGLVPRSVVISPGLTSYSIAATPGSQQEFSATLTFDDGSVLHLEEGMTWTSSAPSVLDFGYIYFPSLAFLHKPGDVTITATPAHGPSGSLTISLVP
jgi:hypothetical protein